MVNFHNKVTCWDIVGCKNSTVDYYDQFFLELGYMLQDSKQGNMHVYPSPFFPYKTLCGIYTTVQSTSTKLNNICIPQND